MPNVLELLPEAETGEICVDWSSTSPGIALVGPEQRRLAEVEKPAELTFKLD